MFIYQRRAAGRTLKSSLRHVERTNPQRTVIERLQTRDKQLIAGTW